MACRANELVQGSFKLKLVGLGQRLGDRAFHRSLEVLACDRVIAQELLNIRIVQGCEPNEISPALVNLASRVKLNPLI